VSEAERLTTAFAALGGEVDSAFERMGVPVFVIDRAGLIRYLNKCARQWFGDVHNRPFTDIFALESRSEARAAFTKKLLGTERVNTAQRRLLTLNGEVLARVHAVAIEAGERVVGVFEVASPEAVVRGRGLSLADPDLTPRQAAVLDRLATGMSTEQIAADLGIAADTVRNHIRSILQALGVHSRLQAVAEARRRGLLSD
jgi:PAS domain S-box-containing protein